MKLIRNPILPRLPDNKDPQSLEQWERDVLGMLQKLHEDIYDDINALCPAEGVFADIHVEDGSTAQSIPTGTTYTKLTGFAENGLSKNCTADVANDKITFQKVGYYAVQVSINGSITTPNIVFKFAAFLNGVEQHQVHGHIKFQGASDYTSCSFSGHIHVDTIGWDLDVRARHDDGGSISFTPTYMNLSTRYLGEVQS